MKKVLVMGMGAIGHTIVTSLDDTKVEIDVVTSTPVAIDCIENNLGDKSKVSKTVTYEQLLDNCDYDYIFLTLPYRHKISRMEMIGSAVKPNAVIIILPGNQGAINYLPKQIQENNPIILFERVPQISRIDEKYKRVNVFGTRHDLKMVGVNGANPLEMGEIIPYMTDIEIMNNELEISLISSNAVIHTCRIYNMFKDRDDNYNREFGFYSEWTLDDAELFNQMELEVIALKEKIEQVEKIEINFYDAFTHFGINPITSEKTQAQISTNQALNGIRFFVADPKDLMANRYLVDDAILGIYYYLKLGEKYGVKLPKMEMVHNWAVDFCDEQIHELEDLYV